MNQPLLPAKESELVTLTATLVGEAVAAHPQHKVLFVCAGLTLGLLEKAAGNVHVWFEAHWKTPPRAVVESAVNTLDQQI